MHQRFFSQGTVPVSEIGLGCWQLGGDWGPVSDDDAFATLRGAVGSGVSFLDTADVYGGGRSESVIGRFLKQSGDRPFVATKLGRGAPPDGMLPFSPEALRAATEASLQRLGVARWTLPSFTASPWTSCGAAMCLRLYAPCKARARLSASGPAWKAWRKH